MERKRMVTFKGQAMTLVGEPVHTGEPAPDFEVVNGSLEPVRLSNFRGQKVLISSVPSLDTSVCSAQTQRMNQEAAGLDMTVLTISMDLPFAQQRFCEANQVANVHVLSDYRDRDFANTYGLLIDELKLCARAVLIVDQDGIIVYQQIVPEIAQEPDYEEVLEQARKT